MRHPIHAMPFADGDVANALAAEFAAQRFGRRWQLLRKAWGRELGLVLTGQARRRVERVPATTRRLLWHYSWATVGDAVLDLAPRRLIPAGIEADLLIAPHLAPLFATDDRFARVFTDWAEVEGEHDFVLLDSLRSSSLRAKARHARPVPFATMREHHAGERFDRAAYADRRLRQLFGLASGPVVAPHLELGIDRPVSDSRARSIARIGVPLGARVAHKLYPHWSDVLERLVASWPDPFRPPRFHLLGSGDSAREQLAGLDPALRAAYCVSRIDAGSLRDAAIELAQCDAFLGVDGGLMHVAIGVGTPGLALFTGIEPRYFLRPESTMKALASAAPLAKLKPKAVVDAFIAALPAFVRR